MVEQLSVFMENKKGAMRDLLALISAQSINVLGFVTNDSPEFGIVRMVLSDTGLAQDTLKSAGYQCKVSHVIGVAIEDEPGRLQAVLDLITDMNIGVDYMYVGYSREDNMPITIIQCEAAEEVSDMLSRRGYKVY